ncbi:MAG TPA: hypothetical protein VMA53_03575 [Stellaceae bacterium]|nr:hypothetical protein [Stellaceae bacterium]
MLIAAMLPVQSAFAGVYADNLSQCLVKSAKPQDQLLLLQWSFAAISAHPAVQPMLAISSEQREKLSRQASEVFVRLITADCPKQAIDTIKHEGQAAFSSSFAMLGQMAMRGLMTEPHVVQAEMQLFKYVVTNEKLMTFAMAAAASAPPAAAAPAK